MRKLSALGIVLVLVAILPLAGLAQEPSSVTAPEGYVPSPVSSAPGPQAGTVCIFKDVNPWDSTATETILSANGIPYEVHGSGEFGSLNFDAYGMIYVACDQTQGFYDAYAGYVTKFETYVAGGGFLMFCAADMGWNGGSLNAPLPGGMTYAFLGEDYNAVDDPGHPSMAGVPNPYSGSWASHGVFSNLPPGAHTIASGQSSGSPVEVEYPIGAGWFVGMAQTLEITYDYGWDGTPILPNTLIWGYNWSGGAAVFATHMGILHLPGPQLLLGYVRAATGDGSTPVGGAVVDVEWVLPNGTPILQTRTANANGVAFPVMLGRWPGQYWLFLQNITAPGYTYDPSMNWVSQATIILP
jgi:hypothetical protein